MSEKLGQMSFGRDRRPIFIMPGQPEGPGDYSEETSREIDCEVRRIIDEQHERVTSLLSAQEEGLRRAAVALLKKEVITGQELKEILGRDT